MAHLVEQKTGNPKVQGSHLNPNILKLCVSGHGLSSIYVKLLSTVRESDGEDGRAVNSETQGCGFYPHMGQFFFFFF